MDSSIKPLAVIMAAGKGTRMRSTLPKVLHPFHGAPMIAASVSAVRSLCDDVVVVVGHGAEAVSAVLPPGVIAAVQAEQRGTGHAVQCALEAIPAADRSVIVIPGDHPRVSGASLAAIVAAREAAGVPLAMGTCKVPDFEGERIAFADFGRIERDAAGRIAAIVEKKDASAAQADVTEVNVSCYCFSETWLREHVAQLDANNAAGEFYLTALIAMAAKQGHEILGVPFADWREGMGVNTPEQLAIAETA